MNDHWWYLGLLFFLPILWWSSPLWMWPWRRMGDNPNDIFSRRGRYQDVIGFNYPVGPHTGVGSKKYKRSDDRIEEEIHERFIAHGELDASDIDVVVRHGEVTLSGFVQTKRMRRIAEDVAENVYGVVEVHNLTRISALEATPKPRRDTRTDIDLSN